MALWERIDRWGAWALALGLTVGIELEIHYSAPAGLTARPVTDLPAVERATAVGPALDEAREKLLGLFSEN